VDECKALLVGIVAKLDVATMRNIKAGFGRYCYCSPRHKVPFNSGD